MNESEFIDYMISLWQTLTEDEEERMMFKEMCESMDTWSADSRKFLKASRRL